MVRWMVLGGLLAGCAASSPAQTPSASGAAATDAASKGTEAQLRALYAEAFETRLARHPMFQTQLGIKTDYDKWDDISVGFLQEERALTEAYLGRLRKLEPEGLDSEARLNYRLFEHTLMSFLESFQWQDYEYPLNQMYGWHSGVVAFLINQHRVDQVADAQAYIRRLEGIAPLFDQVVAKLDRQLELSVVAPRFVYPMVKEDAQNVLTGAPFSKSGTDSPLLADFKGKLEGLGLSEAERSTLVEGAVQALRQRVAPAYGRLMEAFARHEAVATADDGAWKFPQGNEYYRHRLRQMTTTDLGPEEIHRLGLQEVDRIHGEMKSIMSQVGYEGSLSEFFDFMRTAERFYLPNDEWGRSAYLKQAKDVLKRMEAVLPDYFGRLPQADMRVKPVEPFREKSAGKAFYNSPSLDGTRPGTYYVNLYDMSAMPTYQLEALAYHEGLPGHHMQIAIAQELEDVPRFRRFGRYTAYTEGWGLYSEYLPKEMGMYEDPYSDFGRLAMELWRACRLVVDTGIHFKRWTREEAIDYLVKNTPNPRPDAVKAIERYIVMPGQATAYKVGMLKILELRADAQERLGDAFDLKAFHDLVLGGGPMPLSVLEDRITRWVQARLPS